jgi:flagellar protein FlaG
MGIPITAAGYGIAITPQQELPQERGSARYQQMRAKIQTTEAKSAALEKFTASLPGNQEPRTLRATAADLERISLAFNKKLKFVVDHQSHEVTVKVIDAETDKVIKVLPPEELQRLHNKIRETIGFLFDERV